MQFKVLQVTGFTLFLNHKMWVGWTNQPTNFMEQSTCWEANISSGSQGIPQILWNMKVHYHIQMCLQPDPILSQINPVHASPPTSWKWKSILILTSHLSLSYLKLRHVSVFFIKPSSGSLLCLLKLLVIWNYRRSWYDSCFMKAKQECRHRKPTQGIHVIWYPAPSHMK